VADEHDAVQRELIEPGVEIASVIGVQIRHVGLAGAAHPDKVGREAAAWLADPWQHVPPEIPRGRVTTEKYERHPSPRLLAEHCRVEHIDRGHSERPFVDGVSAGGSGRGGGLSEGQTPNSPAHPSMS